jgi:alkaline phosphatase D
VFRVLTLVVFFGCTFCTSVAVADLAHGVSSGEITDSSVVIWSRYSRSATMYVAYTEATGVAEVREARTRNSAANDFTAQVTLTKLKPDTQYRYEVSFKSKGKRSKAVAGLFRTAPVASAPADVTLVFSGDLAGQRYCRRPDVGYRIFAPMAQLQADFFVANGDMIYADNDCPENGIEPGWQNIPADFPGVGSPLVNWMDTAAVAEVFNAHWRYNREDQDFQAFLATTPVYVQWDDHEVINDFGAPWDTYPPQAQREGFGNVVAAGRKSLFDYHPITRHSTERDRIYRSFRWGKHVELFILDARSYRSSNADPDTSDKTMLGAAQLAWITDALVSSDATWKIVSSDVPLSVPTGSQADRFGHDAFAGNEEVPGFESELSALLKTLDAADVNNIVFIATDVHSAAQLRYTGDYNGDGDELLFHELIAGPLSAIRGAGIRIDPSFGPEKLYGEGRFFNFATVRIQAGANARLRADVRDELGTIRPGSELVLNPLFTEGVSR